MLLSYVDDYAFWYKYEELGKWFVDIIGERFHINFLGYAHWDITTQGILNNSRPSYICHINDTELGDKFFN